MVASRCGSEAPYNKPQSLRTWPQVGADISGRPWHTCWRAGGCVHKRTPVGRLSVMFWVRPSMHSFMSVTHTCTPLTLDDGTLPNLTAFRTSKGFPVGHLAKDVQYLPLRSCPKRLLPGWAAQILQRQAPGYACPSEKRLGRLQSCICTPLIHQLVKASANSAKGFDLTLGTVPTGSRPPIMSHQFQRPSALLPTACTAQLPPSVTTRSPLLRQTCQPPRCSTPVMPPDHVVHSHALSLKTAWLSQTA